MQPSSWHTSPVSYKTVRSLASALGSSEVLATILARRGFIDPEQARDFLSSSGELHDPFLFPDMKAACKIIRQAIDSGEKVCIHGDYDVDGITATALLLDVLETAGADVSYHLPNRFSDGYGVATETVSHLADQGTELLITVDCGIVAGQELAIAADRGMDSIVVDHHRPMDGSLPDCPVISPLLCEYPFKELAGVGLAFKLAQGLLADVNKGTDDGLHPILQRQLDLVALGTIADVVPLMDENRTLVKRGLVQMARTGNHGLRALMRVSQLDPSRLNAGLVAFRLAPRINAAGRIGEPDQALALLRSETEKEAEEHAESLNSLNRERQRIENMILAEAQSMVSKMPDQGQEHHGFVLSSPDWNEGVVGIVASRMVDIHHCPVILIAEGESQGKGSGRSIPAFDLHAAMVELSGHLAAFGGHRAACGLTIDLDQLEEFRNDFAAIAERELAGLETTPSRRVDALVLGNEMTLDLAEELSQLEPYGLGNPSAELLAAGVRLEGCRKTRDGNHLQCRVRSGGNVAGAIGFGQAHLNEKFGKGADCDVVFRLEKNEYNGSVAPQLNLRDVMPEQDGLSCLAELCSIRCNTDCENRIHGEEFRKMIQDSVDLPPAWLNDGMDPVDPERIIDRTGLGSIPQQVARLAANGERILLLVSDVARRQRLLTHELPISDSMIDFACFTGSRCSTATLKARIKDIRKMDGNSSLVVMADFTTASLSTELPSCFEHLVFVDPPYNPAVFNSIAGNAPAAWLHLIYCEDELQFTQMVLEHEYRLQEPLKRTYRNLNTGESHPLEEATERALLAGGKYLRQPHMVARCIAILRELDLVSVEETDKGPILTVLESGKTELERSAIYRKNDAFYERCQNHLNRLRNRKTI